MRRLDVRFDNCGDKLNIMTRLLISLLFVWAAESSDISHTRLTVTIRPAVALSRIGDGAISVKIRLGPSAKGVLWRGDTCHSPPSNGYIISRSGTYSISLASIEGHGVVVCFKSADDRLQASIFVGRTTAEHPVSSVAPVKVIDSRLHVGPCRHDCELA